MEARIGEYGLLEIKRAGKWAYQHCRFDTEKLPCGDDCPLFEEYSWGSIKKVRLCCGSGIARHEITEDKRHKEVEDEHKS